MYPILARWGDVTFYSYGFVMMATLFAIYFLARHTLEDTLLDHSQLGDISFLAVFSVWFGGGLMSLLFSGDFSWAKLQTSLDPRRLQYVGTMAVSASFGLSLWGYCLWKRLPFWRVMDFLIPGFVLGYALQRSFGCMAAGCCHGIPTELPWGIVFPENPLGVGPPVGVRIHPTQLYMGLAALATSRFLFVQRHALRHAPGSLTGLGIMGLFGVYFLVGFWRADLQNEGSVSGLSGGQRFALALFVLGLGVWQLSLRRARRAGRP
ncbi:MAG: prolipoprotein diacylglyceryl transferase [Magnetococcales bacterium]|nr:prolipoprotein diacylglyceryl transferase [Magnetococcales bacterium]